MVELRCASMSLLELYYDVPVICNESQLNPPVCVTTPTFLQYADMVSSGGPTLMTWPCGKSSSFFAATKSYPSV